jgi:hypothetical protein
LGDEKDVSIKGLSEDNGDVGNVEEFDGVLTPESAVASVLEGNIHSVGFHENDNSEV